MDKNKNQIFPDRKNIGLLKPLKNYYNQRLLNDLLNQNLINVLINNNYKKINQKKFNIKFYNENKEYKLQ